MWYHKTERFQNILNIRSKRLNKLGRNGTGPKRHRAETTQTETPQADTTQAETTQGRNDSGPKLNWFRCHHTDMWLLFPRQKVKVFIMYPSWLPMQNGQNPYSKLF